MNQRKSARGNQSILLPDGRRLGYAEYGASKGSTVLFFHGAPGSRHIHADMDDLAEQRDTRLIAVERPGYGLSDPQPGRSILDWPNDIEALTDAIDVDQFALIGFSMGSPYALACAYMFPHRLTKVALVGALAPPDVPGVMEGMSPMVSGLYALAQSNPDELRNIFASLAQSPAALLEAMAESVIEWDKNVIRKRASEFEADFTETLRGGVEGVFSDFVLASGNWGFTLDDIKTEIHLWHGTADRNTPPAMADYFASMLPNNRKYLLPGEGHFALFVRLEEILAQLV